MTFLLSKKKEDLIELAEELGLIIEADLTKPKLKDLIVKSPDYVEEDVKIMFDSIVKDRIHTEEKAKKLRREEREYELEKLRIRAEKITNTMNNSENVQAPKLIHETFHKFNMKDDISLNLTLFERHAELTFLPKKDWERYEASGSNDTYFQRTEYLQSGSNRREKKYFQLNGTSYSGKSKRLICSYCKGPGHYAVDCTKSPKCSKINNSTDSSIQICSRISRERIKTRKITMGNKIIEALIDSGSSVSLIRENVSKGIIEPSELSKDIAVLFGLGID
ncbi:peptidase A2 domain-containing protein [Trichonephila inaurata madagascariensis]|uniref:Peptidase A2 domain-containing protein n=1 Tax=Trichonephila inaurata madagascariensis TaxID=2747483 RepID=A0A8X7CAI3_9ARAC|nr:peptidase A2 domain-containing protein [Trichonephila inaurata madagascariensis]